MKIIAHRKNTIADLIDTPKEHGVEIDIRSKNGELILQHEPYVEGELFIDWIKSYKHATLILNVKEDGLEEKLIGYMHEFNIVDYFFLDQPFPTIIKTSKLGEKRCAVRVSEFEALDTALMLAGKIDWVWIDCFTKFPLSSTETNRLRDAGFKLCLVSPELQGRTETDEISSFIALIRQQDIIADAVCTKRADLWKKL